MIQISQVVTGTAAELASDNRVWAAGVVITESDTLQKKTADGTTAYSSLAYVGAAKRYRALISQTSTGDPTVDLLIEDSIAGVWARSSTGVYTYTKTGVFTSGKTYVRVGPPDSQLTFVSAIRTSANVITLSTFLLALTSTDPTGYAVSDGRLTKFYVEIVIEH